MHRGVPRASDSQFNTCGSQGGLVVINRASHLCDPGSGYSGFPPSSKSTLSQLHLAGFAVLRDHTWIVWRQPWAPSFGPILLNQLILKSPVGSGRLSAFVHVYMV